RAVTVALTGAACPAAIDGDAVGFGQRFALAAGATLSLGPPPTGLRSYLSVAGGIDVPPVLGSRSTDLLSGIGPPRLSPGTLLPVGEPGPEEPASAVSGPRGRHDAPRPVLELLPGPRTDWLADADALASTWTVSPDSNRVGIRLTGTVLDRSPSRLGAELPSEPLVRGAVQLPPSGHPVIFGPDHPTTGGYPVVAVLTEAASDRLAQCRPGEFVRLRWALRDAAPAPRQ
ncbi:MAG TPA: biotin-dependent carboxyltransferase family protein, partial [Propionicimonas sp.]|uniref:5-oxoprolinase subunit C family protein n=1 Tax=Propionicimonas sp. TaxID=1955623 RepID=UPI002F3E331F